MFLSAAFAQNAPLESAALEVSEKAADHGGNFPPFDSSFFGSHLFWLALSFACFYFLMARCVIPRIGSILETRANRIASDLDQAAAAKKEADEAIELYQQQLEKARNQAQTLARKALDEAHALSQAEQAKAETALAQRFEAAEQHITKLQGQAMGHVEKIATEAAELILLVLTDRKLDKSTIGQAVKLAAQN